MTFSDDYESTDDAIELTSDDYVADGEVIEFSPADLQLANMVNKALARLNLEMDGAPHARDRISAANSILDRAGYSRTPRLQADQADEQIRIALEAVNATAKAVAQAVVEAQNPLAALPSSPVAPATSPEEYDLL